ncbi:MAG TPA: PAS domain-containing protein [Pedomonas sp.]|uniref:PAS domain-containing protein n=1 Tax=Pedomonas sp. TaxID=2976421 RepID=UPI002F413880
MSTLAIVLLLIFCIGVLLAFIASLIYLRRQRLREARALAELVESKRFYLTLIDNNLDTLAVATPDGRFRFVNKSLIDLLGFTPEQMQQMDLRDYVHPDDMERFLAEWDQLVSGTAPVNFEPFRFADARGVYHWKRLIARNMLADPDIRGLILSSSDITDLINAMNALRQTEQRIRIAMSGADIAVFNVDLSGRLTWMFNPLLDKPPEELLGKTAFEYLPVDVASRLAAMRDKVIREGGHQSDEIDFVDNGKRRVITFHYEQLRGPDGQVVGVVGAAADITKVRVVADQMEVSHRMEAIGQLTGGIAHDFNNLLAVIVGNLELLKDHLHGETQVEHFVDLALTAADRGAALTRSLLAFARKQSLEIKHVDPNKVLKEIAELLRRSLPPSIQLTFRSPEQIWRCRADAGQLQNAIINLVVNARDAMPEGGTITISTANTTLDHDSDAMLPPDVTAGEYVLICVSDTGTGMPPDVVERVFEPFFTTKPHGQGSGLGLSIVYGFAKQLGGHLAIESTPGAGTSVCLYLPRIEEQARETGAAPPAAAPAATGATILVVDDDEDVRHLTVSLLERAGYRTLEADNGDTALDLMARDGTIDVLLTDMLLGSGPSGLDLIKQVETRHPDLPVVLMSGYINPTAVEGVVDQRLDVPLLRKPFRRQQLEAMINEVLASRRPSLPDARHPGPGNSRGTALSDGGDRLDSEDRPESENRPGAVKP